MSKEVKELDGKQALHSERRSKVHFVGEFIPNTVKLFLHNQIHISSEPILASE